MYLFRSTGDRDKLTDACEFFECKPWVAIYVESEHSGDLFLVSLETYERTYGPKVSTQGWNMTPKQLTKYKTDAGVKHIHVDFSGKNWWPEEE